MARVRNCLAQLLNDKSMTQAQLAKACGVSQETIGRIKRHHRDPSAFLMLKIAQVFNLPVEKIFWIEDNPRK